LPRPVRIAARIRDPFHLAVHHLVILAEHGHLRQP
jgi:hypothetical protein